MCVGRKYYAILYKACEHPWSLVSSVFLYKYVSWFTLTPNRMILFTNFVLLFNVS